MTIRDIARNPLDPNYSSAEFLGYRPPVTLPFSYDLYRFVIKSLRDDDKKLGTELMKRLLTGSQDRFRTLYGKVRDLLHAWDYLRCEARFLPELLANVGFPGDVATAGILNDLSELDERRLLFAAAKIWKRKGIEECYDYIGLLLGGVRVEIDDWFYYRWIALDDGLAAPTPIGIMGENRSPNDPWIVSSPGEVVEPDEYITDVTIMDEPWLEMNRRLVTDLFKLTRPSSERLNIAFVEYVDSFADDSDVDVISGQADVVDGRLVHEAQDTVTATKVQNCSSWADVYAAWQLRVVAQERLDALNKIRLLYRYQGPDDHDFLEISLGAGTGTAQLLLGRRLGGAETTLAGASGKVSFDVGYDYVFRVQCLSYRDPYSGDLRQQVRVLHDQGEVILFDELVVEGTPTVGNVGEQSFKAQLSLNWKQVYQVPLSVEHVRPKLRIEPRYLEATTGQPSQFAAAGGGGAYKFSLISNGSGGSITPAGAYVAGGASGTVDRVRLTDRFGETIDALVEVA